MNRTDCTVACAYLHRDPAQESQPKQPTVKITVRMSKDAFTEHLKSGTGDQLTESEIDVTHRYTTNSNSSDAVGVIGVADKITGRFVLEGHLDGETIEKLVNTGIEYADETGESPYAIVFDCEDGPIRFEQDVLLVYSQDNSILREKSLIPNDIIV